MQTTDHSLKKTTTTTVFVARARFFSNEGNSEASGPSIWLFRSLSLNLFQVWPDVTACGTLAVHSSLAEEITGHLWSVILD